MSEELGEQRKGGTGAPPPPARARRPPAAVAPGFVPLSPHPPARGEPSEERGPAGGGHAAVTGDGRDAGPRPHLHPRAARRRRGPPLASLAASPPRPSPAALRK